VLRRTYGLDLIQILPFVGLIECRQDGYFWRLVGTGIVDHFGQDLTGKEYGAGFSPPAFIAATRATFDAVLERGVPFFDEFIYRLPKGSLHAVSRLACPLAAAGARPRMVIHTRIHRYCREEQWTRSVVDQEAWGELQNRWPITSLGEVHGRTAEWLATACMVVEAR
jgi:hypothetical protein